MYLGITTDVTARSEIATATFSVSLSDSISAHQNSNIAVSSYQLISENSIMSDKKSKLPDLSELSSMAGKFFKDVKSSVCEIIEDYKGKRVEKASTEDSAAPASKPGKKDTAAKATKEKKVQETAKDKDAPEEK